MYATPSLFNGSFHLLSLRSALLETVDTLRLAKSVRFRRLLRQHL